MVTNRPQIIRFFLTTGTGKVKGPMAMAMGLAGAKHSLADLSIGYFLAGCTEERAVLHVFP